MVTGVVNHKVEVVAIKIASASDYDSVGTLGTTTMLVVFILAK